ncbi:MAG: hypothetical protein B0W54_04835 [Cellvibrio sp. 79]|nr:MAG: hypothetical protein B0W54_04835 [Cellvibrio sp. 79]
MNAIVNSDRFKTLARMGYAARGAVYLVIGGLAVLAAVGEGGETTDSKGAVVEIMRQPFGTFLLIVLVIGLLGFFIWRLVQGIKDTDGHGKSAKGIAVRSGLIASAISHGLLAAWTIKVLMGDEKRTQHGEQFLTTDLGQIVIGITGLAFVVAGLAHIYKGWAASFEKYMRIPHDKNIWARPVCRFGLISRGVVWCIVAWFFITAALSAKSGEVKGIIEALDLLRESPHGAWLFGIAAAGLFSFGIYSIIEAIYRHINIDVELSPDSATILKSNG